MNDPLANQQIDQPTTARGGFTMRQLACMELRVPESGTEWLDHLIILARRMDGGESVMDLYELTEDTPANDVPTE